MEALKKKANDLKCDVTLELKKTHGSNKFFTVKVRGLGYNHKKKDIKQFFKGLKPKSIRVPTKIKGIAYVGFKTEKLMKQALNKNKSFLGDANYELKIKKLVNLLNQEYCNCIITVL